MLSWNWVMSSRDVVLEALLAASSSAGAPRTSEKSKDEREEGKRTVELELSLSAEPPLEGVMGEDGRWTRSIPAGQNRIQEGLQETPQSELTPQLYGIHGGIKVSVDRSSEKTAVNRQT